MAKFGTQSSSVFWVAILVCFFYSTGCVPEQMRDVFELEESEVMKTTRPIEELRASFTRVVLHRNGHAEQLEELDTSGNRHGWSIRFYPCARICCAKKFEHGKQQGYEYRWTSPGDLAILGFWNSGKPFTGYFLSNEIPDSKWDRHNGDGVPLAVEYANGEQVARGVVALDKLQALAETTDAMSAVHELENLLGIPKLAR